MRWLITRHLSHLIRNFSVCPLVFELKFGCNIFFFLNVNIFFFGGGGGLYLAANPNYTANYFNIFKVGNLKIDTERLNYALT